VKKEIEQVDWYGENRVSQTLPLVKETEAVTPSVSKSEESRREELTPNDEKIIQAMIVKCKGRNIELSRRMADNVLYELRAQGLIVHLHSFGDVPNCMVHIATQIMVVNGIKPIAAHLIADALHLPGFEIDRPISAETNP